MDLRHNRLPWSEQIWAKINADLAQALTQARRVRAPFEVFHVPESQQTVMADRKDAAQDDEYAFTESDTVPIIELAVQFKLAQSQVYNEGDNFYALDRIIGAAYDLGRAEDELFIFGDAKKAKESGQGVYVTAVRPNLDGKIWVPVSYRDEKTDPVIIPSPPPHKLKELIDNAKNRGEEARKKANAVGDLKPDPEKPDAKKNAGKEARDASQKADLAAALLNFGLDTYHFDCNSLALKSEYVYELTASALSNPPNDNTAEAAASKVTREYPNVERPIVLAAAMAEAAHKNSSDPQNPPATAQSIAIAATVCGALLDSKKSEDEVKAQASSAARSFAKAEPKGKGPRKAPNEFVREYFLKSVLDEADQGTAIGKFCEFHAIKAAKAARDCAVKLNHPPTVFWRGRDGQCIRRGQTGFEVYNAVVEARDRLRDLSRYEAFALLISTDLEGDLQSTVFGSNSLNTPIERLRPLVSAGIFSTPALPRRHMYVVSVARSWFDIAQAMEPSVQFMSIDPNDGAYNFRLVERFAFRLKDGTARCKIIMCNELPTD
jgi:hypothetical protein